MPVPVLVEPVTEDIIGKVLTVPLNVKVLEAALIEVQVSTPETEPEALEVTLTYIAVENTSPPL